MQRYGLRRLPFLGMYIFSGPDAASISAMCLLITVDFLFYGDRFNVYACVAQKADANERGTNKTDVDVGIPPRGLAGHYITLLL